jgi:hypothetical protein
MPMLINEVSLLQVTCRLRSRSPKSITGAQSKSIYFTEITNSFVDIFECYPTKEIVKIEVSTTVKMSVVVCVMMSCYSTL